jgi:hypothetical protein
MSVSGLPRSAMVTVHNDAEKANAAMTGMNPIFLSHVSLRCSSRPGVAEEL